MDQAAFDILYKSHFGILVSSLVSFFGLDRLDEAEDIVQETFMTAWDKWNTDPPADPKAWLFRVCKNKAINHLKKQTVQLKRSRSVYETQNWIDYQIHEAFVEGEIHDKKLRVMFALCHPSIPERSQVILILKIIMGFRIEQISNVFGLSIEAIKKILSRSKQKIRENGLNLNALYLLKMQSRLSAVQKVLYLVFNEGYHSTVGKELIRRELCTEAIYYLKLLVELGLSDNSTYALLALMYFNFARYDSRLSGSDELIDLESQDRSLWNREILILAYEYLMKSRESNVLSRYHLEAGISSAHCAAKTYEDTDWCLIRNYYDKLVKISDSPFVHLNRCIAIGYCNGPAQALAEAQKAQLKNSLSKYHVLYVAKGKWYWRLGQFEKAVQNFNKGLELARLEQEKSYIRKWIEKAIA